MKKLIILMFCLISAPVFSNYCATVFQYEGFSGAELDVFDGQKIRSLRSHEMDRYNNRSWDNKISSIEVQPNCKLVLFQYKFMGRDRRTNESIGAKKYLNQITPVCEKFTLWDGLIIKLPHLFVSVNKFCISWS